jgi:hypothetical protein
MRIAVHANRSAHQQRWGNAFAAGLERHGITPLKGDGRQPIACDLAVFWSHKKYPIIEAQKKTGRDYLVLEHGYIGDRISEYASAGYNGLNGNADFVNQDMPPDRWLLFFREYLKPWRPEGNYIVIMGQVPGDQSIRGTDFTGWVAETAKGLRERFDVPIYFRPHPLSGRQDAAGVPLIHGDLHYVLADALGVVTFNSNSGVDALLEGVPTMVCDEGGMAWPVTTHRVEEGFKKLPREQWAWNLAWAQWTEEEFSGGTAWEHLKRKYSA